MLPTSGSSITMSGTRNSFPKVQAQGCANVSQGKLILHVDNTNVTENYDYSVFSQQSNCEKTTFSSVEVRVSDTCYEARNIAQGP